MRHRLAAGIAVLLLGCVPTASLATPSSVPPAAAGAGEDVLLPLAGDAGWLVYKQTASASVAVLARSASGTTQLLTIARASDIGWSVVGHTVVAQRPSVGTVDYWNLQTRRHRIITRPSAAYYLSAAPGGYIYWDREKGLRRRYVAAGKVTSYGGVLRYYLAGVAGPHGVLVTGSDEATKYVPYSRRHHAVELKTTATADDPVECTAIDAKYASCYRFSDDDDYVNPTADLLVPLNGTKAAIASKCPGVPSVSAKTIVWATGTGGFNGAAACVTPSRRLESLTLGESKVMNSSTSVSGPTTSAYGLAIFTSPNGDRFIAASDATHTTTFSPAPWPPNLTG